VFPNEVLTILWNQAAIRKEQEALLEERIERVKHAPGRASEEPIADPAG
jgi:hypothetical protein